MLKSAGKALVILVLGIALGATVAYTAERHPAIRAAQKNLIQAKTALEHADHDFGGHRVKALEHVNAALEELRMAIAFDRDSHGH
jgi:hypothetical protein